MTEYLPEESTRREIITSDGVHLYIEVRGNGTPCLCIHGGPGSGSDWMQQFLGEMLERRFQMIYLDQRGCGRSTSPKDGNYSLDKMVMDFEEVRKALGIRKWIILGHSFGGILQMGYAKDHPKVIRGMIMLNCTLDIEDSLENSWIPKACEILGISDTTEYMDRTVPTADRLSAIRSKLEEKGLLWKMAFDSQDNEKIMSTPSSEASNFNLDFAHTAFAVKDYWTDFLPNTQNMRVPVLFFYGTRDWMVGPAHYKGVHFPCSIMWPSDGGHFAFLENKADLEKTIDIYQSKYRL
ncbi:MAG: alpha/beta fold hydrolase [Armatimonadota bacterium]